jgi:hypothetical protein
MNKVFSIFSIVMLVANFTIAQETNYNLTNDENVFYRFDKKDSSFTFKIKYDNKNDSYIVTDLNLTIEIDSLIDISFLEIPYDIKTKEFEIHMPINNTQDLLKAKNIDLYLTVRQIGDTETVCLSNTKGCLTGKTIRDNIKLLKH